MNSKCGQTPLKKRLISVLAVILIFNLLGCQQSQLPEPTSPTLSAPQRQTQMGEVSPPQTIQLLHPSLDIHQPQVSILSPQSDEILQDNTIDVQVEVQDLPLFRDETLGLGPHLQIILDNQPLKNIYTLDEPITLSNLEAGTHTLRVFAAYPWEESFKNDGAYAQSTFHVFTKTPDNNPNPELPQLTYNQPRGTYGAEPVLLDFFLANAPLHLVAQENPEDEIVDWRIRVTLNGESFIIDRWQPIFIEGVKPGKNWVQLEYLDELGEPVTNVYNNTARVFTYDPNFQDTLSQLIKGELSIAEARPIVDSGFDPSIVVPVVEETPETEETVPSEVEETLEPEELIPPEIEETPETEEPVTSDIEETLEPETIPETEETLEPEEPVTSEIEETLEPETIPEAEEIPDAIESDISTEVEEPVETVEPEAIEENMAPTLEETTETEVEEIPVVEEPEPLPQTEETELIIPIPVEPKTEPEPESSSQTNQWFNQIKSKIQQLPILQRNNSETSSASISSEADSSENPSETNNFFQGILNRFQQIPFFQAKTSQPQPVETLPEIVDEVPEPTEPVELETSPELIPSETLELTPEAVEPEAKLETDTEEPVIITPEIEPETLPEIVEETPIVEPETQLEEPIVNPLETEPETLPEIVEETPIVEPEPQLKEPVVTSPETSDEPLINNSETESSTILKTETETSTVTLESKQS
ncbi:MAG: hypothetical protein AAFO04_26850 [Cyanobacteria bacterium J06592_8]